ncbi:response regulator PleD [Geobacter sp. OR-1]|uniref:diguanylate cyclase n=1 Tax=Geobacter sp. OR-1 TaxID=1266765 RepID=UPI0005445709|nr:diguanylate cyclase [Geobacter sp. OR-1]GAM11554.1 response regulator PleD [Geobacter sp. OR-1]
MPMDHIHSNLRILIVEDNPLDQAILIHAIEKYGYDYVTASNGRQAIDLYRQEFFPIIITDLMMPEMNGLELCAQIRSMRVDSYIYIILLTGLDSKEDLIKGLKAGADEYIVKPVHFNELQVRLKGAERILDLESSLKMSLAEIRKISIRDPLTRAFNRGYLDHQLIHEIKRNYRYRHALSVMICDLDHFKTVNDTYGHQAGDEVLKKCVEKITNSIRQNVDWVARYGGEEFVVVLPETDLAGCLVVAERIRLMVASANVVSSGNTITITVSIGAVTVDSDTAPVHQHSDQLLNSADKCLYQAKEQGRNRVIAIHM